jgi:hypothetical protein
MIEGYKIKPFVPAGRKQTLQILVRYFQKHRNIIDEVMLWLNTDVESDIDYIKDLAKKDSLFKVYEIPEGYKFFHRGESTLEDRGRENYGPLQWNTGRFFEYCTDPDTIYFRFDDDIVYIEDDYFQNMVKFRIENPEYWAVFGNIWNNAIISYLHQQEGNIGLEFGECTTWCMDEIGWGSGEFAEYIHEIILKKIKDKTIKELYLKGNMGNEDVIWDGNGYVLANGYRFSISNFAFFGKDYAEFGGKFSDLDEEIWLTEKAPMLSGRSNAICPNALVSHFTFSPHQKPHIMQNTDILKRYDKLSKEELSKGYYNGL